MKKRRKDKENSSFSLVASFLLYSPGANCLIIIINIIIIIIFSWFIFLWTYGYVSFCLDIPCQQILVQLLHSQIYHSFGENIPVQDRKKCKIRQEPEVRKEVLEGLKEKMYIAYVCMSKG